MTLLIEKRPDGSRRVARVVEGPSMAVQSSKDECDVNFILRKYPGRIAQSQYMMYSGRYDYAPAVEFHEALDIVREGEEMFMALPAKLRNRFEGDPGAFLAFVQDPDNLAEMRELGLAEPLPVVRPAGEERAQPDAEPERDGAPSPGEVAPPGPPSDGGG